MNPESEEPYIPAPIPPEIKEHMDAHHEGGARLRDYYLGIFRGLRDDWSNELPWEDVRNLTTLDEKGLFKGDKYKCRGNYIFALTSRLRSVVESGVMQDPDIMGAIDHLCKHDFNFQHEKRTSWDEIFLMNNALQLVIQYLEGLQAGDTKK